MMQLLSGNCVEIYQDSVVNVAGYTILKIVLKLLLDLRTTNYQNKVSTIDDVTSKFGLEKGRSESGSSIFSLIFILEIWTVSKDFYVKNV